MVNGCRNNWKRVITGSLIACVFAVILRSTKGVCHNDSSGPVWPIRSLNSFLIFCRLPIFCMFHFDINSTISHQDLQTTCYKHRSWWRWLQCRDWGMLFCMICQNQLIYFRSKIWKTNAFHCNFQTFRGYAWKGRDCNDLYKHIHPGAR